MAANLKVESRGPQVERQGAPTEGRLLTREELAVVLKVSVCTVDRMLADGEIPHVRIRGTLVRFYLPDVVRQLVATALTRKRGRARVSGNSEVRNPKSEDGSGHGSTRIGGGK
jgi:excisionase family DNA binding protein